MKTLFWHGDLELDAKDPADSFLLVIDWSDKIGGEPLTAVSVSAQTGLVVADHANDSTTQTIKISGGTDGNTYTVTVDADTANQHFERSFKIPVEDL